MLPLLVLVLTLDPAPPPVGPSISLELKILPQAPAKPGADAALDKLMVKASGHGDEVDIVKTTVTIRARGEVMVDPQRVSLVLLKPSSPAIRSRSRMFRLHGDCVEPLGHCASPPPDEKRVRLRTGETITLRLDFDLGCYGLTAGEKVVLAAEFEDGGDPWQKPPSPEVTIAMRWVQSNRVVLTYRGEKP